MYRVYRTQAAAACWSLYFFIFLSLQFSDIKIFCHTFLRKCGALKVETWYTCGMWADVSCIPESGCCCLFVPLFHCQTCFSMGDLGVQVSVLLSIRQHLPWVSCERNSSYSFVPIFLKLCMCFHHGMRICMWFGYNYEIIFCHFFHFVNLVIF